jgi:hypothetical protein
MSPTHRRHKRRKNDGEKETMPRCEQYRVKIRSPVENQTRRK